MTDSDKKEINIDWILPEAILKLNKIFKENGYELYIVGGAVRDKLLDKEPSDYDLCTNAKPTKVKEILDPFYYIYDNGASFDNGVVNIAHKGSVYEIATFRRDIGDGRRPDRVEFTSIEEDAKRRDLTINALYYDIDNKKIIDYVGGVDDVKNSIVRTVGNTRDRFREDRLRLLRSIRFATRLGSDLNEEIDKELRRDNSLNGVSNERIRNEFLSSLLSTKSIKCLINLINKYKFFDQIFNGLEINLDLVDNLNLINKDNRCIYVIMATLLINNDIKKIKTKFNDLKYESSEISKILFLIRFKELKIDNAYKLKKEESESKISVDQIKQFSQVFNMDQKLVNTFLKYSITIDGNQLKLEGFTGKNIGIELENRENKLFNTIYQIMSNF